VDTCCFTRTLNMYININIAINDFQYNICAQKLDFQLLFCFFISNVGEIIESVLDDVSSNCFQP